MFRLISQKFDMEQPVYTIEEIDKGLNKRDDVREGAKNLGEYETFEEANRIKDIFIKYDSMSQFERNELVKKFARKHGWSEEVNEVPDSYAMSYIDLDLCEAYDLNVCITLMVLGE